MLLYLLPVLVVLMVAGCIALTLPEDWWSVDDDDRDW